MLIGITLQLFDQGIYLEKDLPSFSADVISGSTSLSGWESSEIIISIK